MSESDEMDWPSYEHSYQLHDAQVVGMMDHGGVIVEQLAELTVTEGRRLASYGGGDSEEPYERYEYHFTFDTHGDDAPECSAAGDGEIVITGRHDNGGKLQISGAGSIGFDERGRLDGSFDVPPRVEILSGPDESERLKQEAREMHGATAAWEAGTLQ
jgi:hypothetical protein